MLTNPKLLFIVVLEGGMNNKYIGLFECKSYNHYSQVDYGYTLTLAPGIAVAYIYLKDKKQYTVNNAPAVMGARDIFLDNPIIPSEPLKDTRRFYKKKQLKKLKHHCYYCHTVDKKSRVGTRCCGMTPVKTYKIYGFDVDILGFTEELSDHLDEETDEGYYFN